MSFTIKGGICVENKPTNVATVCELLSNIRNTPPENVRVIYAFRDDNGRVRRHKQPLAALYRDWFGDCQVCPANDEKLLKATIESGGNASVVLSDGTLEFGEMMAAFEQTWALKKT